MSVAEFSKAVAFNRHIYELLGHHYHQACIMNLQGDVIIGDAIHLHSPMHEDQCWHAAILTGALKRFDKSIDASATVCADLGWNFEMRYAEKEALVYPDPAERDVYFVYRFKPDMSPAKALATALLDALQTRKDNQGDD